MSMMLKISIQIALFKIRIKETFMNIQVIDLRKGRALQKGQLAIIVWIEPLMTSNLPNFLLDYWRIIALS